MSTLDIQNQIDPNDANDSSTLVNLDMKDPAVPLNFAVFLHNRKQSEEAKKMLHLFEIRVQKLRATPGLDADPDVLQAASNLAGKMEFNLSISGVPKPATSKRRDSVPESAKSSRKSALKSARAAGKAQLKAEGNAANEDDIRVPTRQSRAGGDMLDQKEE